MQPKFAFALRRSRLQFFRQFIPVAIEVVADVPDPLIHHQELFPNVDEWINPGDAVIFQPFGGPAAGPMHKEKGLLIADIDVSAARASRRKFDVAGHYARPVVFWLTVNKTPQSPIVFE